MKESFLNH